MLFPCEVPDVGYHNGNYEHSQPTTPNQGHNRQFSTNSRSSAITYRRFSLQPPPFTEKGNKELETPIGTEPGINYQNTLVELVDSVGSDITCTDYSKERIKISQLDVGVTDGSANENVLTLLKTRPQWSKVRWININGLSSEAIGPIAQHYNLHPLVVEDMLDIPQRTKVDVFENSMFACFPLHMLRETAGRKSLLSRFRCMFSRNNAQGTGHDDHYYDGSTTSSSSLSSTEKVYHGLGLYKQYQRSSSNIGEKLNNMPGRVLHQLDNNYLHKDDPIQLKILPEQYRRKRVELEQVSLYFTEDTVITFFERGAPSILEPLMTRLMSPTFILRASVDTGILAQAIIDTCVDMIHPIVSEYSTRIRRLQIEAIQYPTLTHTRTLNVLLADLNVLRTSINSMCGMINALRARRIDHTCISHHYRLSDNAFLYFGDVLDHISSYVNDFAIMHEQTKQMTTLIFNTISIRSSNAVRLLSLVTVVFLPLSFLTGYFGMNFTDFEILNNSVDYYWCIAGPFTGALAVLLTYPWIFEEIKNMWFSSQ